MLRWLRCADIAKNVGSFEGADLFVFRYKYNSDGSWELKNSKPCVHCVGPIKDACIRRVYYSVNDADRGPGIEYLHSMYLTADYMTLSRKLDAAVEL
jgi:tRNA(Arg) A34 adenosine deaminase TadA